ncbi:Phospholipase/carboxylesterase, partial [Rhodotorula diobovata]
DEHTVTAIVVHGLGDKGDGLPWTAALADRFPFVRWVAPTADYLNVTVRNGATTRAWFDIVTFDDIWGDEDVVGYTHSQQQLNQLIDDERREMLESGKEARIVLLGFSQGGVMTLLATLTAPRADRIEAAAVMSTYLPFVDSFDDILSSAARDTPLLWVHGRADPYLTYANAELSLARLTSPPISLSDVAFSGYDGVQHSWNGDMLDDVAAWFEDKVPR